MSDEIRHECGVALVRLLKPHEYYRAKYETSDWGGTKLSLLLEKQHNRGQDGAGAAILRAHPVPGESAYTVFRSASSTPLADILGQLGRRGIASCGDCAFLGHLRYATFGKGDVSCCHPFVHKSSCLARTLLLAGNFNLTDNADLLKRYVALGHHPDSLADGYLITQTIAHFIGRAMDESGAVDMASVLRRALRDVDGAYTLCGMTADCWSFAVRDPNGIRPGFYYANEDAVVVASERPAIQAAFDCAPDAVKEIPPGSAVVVSPEGDCAVRNVLPQGERKSCSFERIYFSRANDGAIHRERKALGASLVKPVLASVDGDLGSTFFSYIPNSAQVAFHGLLEELIRTSSRQSDGDCPQSDGDCPQIRFGQIAVKDAKFRTFIADAAARREFYKHVYDVTYGLVRPGEDTLVVLDDSIVRGNTMKRAILPMLDRLGPRRLVIASSAPPIRYPDCYGIDMSTLGELVAFRALVNLLDGERAAGRSEKDANAILAEALKSGAENPLAALYARFSDEMQSAEIARLLTPPGMKAEVKVVFQTVEALHASCPGSAGDWYFTGDYPTKGGYRVLHRALENYLEKSNDRPY